MAGVTHSGPCRRHSLVNTARLEAEQNAAALCSGGRRAAGVREAGGGRGGTRCWSCARDGREAPTLLITVRRQSEDVAGPRRRHTKRFPLFQPESGEPRDQGQESVLAHGQVTSQLGLKSPPPTAPTSPETLHGASSPVRLGPSAAPAAQAPPSAWTTGSHRCCQLSPSPNSGPRSNVVSSEKPPRPPAAPPHRPRPPPWVRAWPAEAGGPEGGQGRHHRGNGFAHLMCVFTLPTQAQGANEARCGVSREAGTGPLLCSLLRGCLLQISSTSTVTGEGGHRWSGYAGGGAGVACPRSERALAGGGGHTGRSERPVRQSVPCDNHLRQQQLSPSPQSPPSD